MEARLNHAKEEINVKLIRELKAFNNPPKDVSEVLDVYMEMFGQKKDWITAKKMMADPSKFVRLIKEYNYKWLNPKTRINLAKFIAN